MGKRRTRKRYEASFKSRVALSAIRGDKTISELASQFGVHGNLVSQWKRRLLANVSRVCEEPDDPEGRAQQEMIDKIHRKIGKLNMDLDWLKKKAAQFGG